MSQTVTQKQCTESKSESSAQSTQPWPSLCAQAATLRPGRAHDVVPWRALGRVVAPSVRWHVVSQRCVAPLDHDTIFVSRPSSQPRALYAVSSGRPRQCHRLPGRIVAEHWSCMAFGCAPLHCPALLCHDTIPLYRDSDGQ